MTAPEGKPRWLVTGANGFLGANLGRFLRDSVATVGLVREGQADYFDESVMANLLDANEVDRVIEESHPDVIVHAAAMASHEACEADPDLAHRVNTVATETVARAAQRIGAHLIFVSTDAVFDGRRGQYSEMDEPSPFSTYGRTKAQAEEIVLAMGSASVARTNFFGWSPTGQRSILEFFVNNLRSGNPVRGFTDFTVTSAYVRNLCDYLFAVGAKRLDGVMHLTSPDPLTKYQFGVSVAREFDLDSSLITPASADVQPPRDRDISLDVTLTQRILDRELVTQVAGIHHARLDEVAVRSALHSRP